MHGDAMEEAQLTTEPFSFTVTGLPGIPIATSEVSGIASSRAHRHRHGYRLRHHALAGEATKADNHSHKYTGSARLAPAREASTTLLSHDDRDRPLSKLNNVGNEYTPVRELDGTTTTPAPSLEQERDSTAPVAGVDTTPAPEPNPTPAPVSIPSPTSPPKTPAPAKAPEPTPAPVPVTAAPVVKPTAAPLTPAPTPWSPAPVTVEEELETPAPSEGAIATVPPEGSSSSGGSGDDNQVSTPYFSDSNPDYVMTATLHISCDTDGATIYYTVDGSDPGKGLEGSQKYDAAGKIVVHNIGKHTVKAIGTKEGMQDSDIASKAFEIQELVATPALTFRGELEEYREDTAYLRNVTITFECSTPNSMIYYTTDGVSDPTEGSPLSAVPGTQIMWAEEGTTTFKAAAFAYDMFPSDIGTSEVTIVAPRLDQHALAETPMVDAVDDMLPLVEVNAFESIYAPPGAELEQEEMLGPGYGECDGGSRIVRGKLLRLMNPKKHFSIVAPPDACGDVADPSSIGELALASKTAMAYEPVRPNATLQNGESPQEAWERLGLAEREAAWRAAEDLGCQAAAAGGMLGLPGGAAGCVGHLVAGGVVLRVDNGTTGMVNFGVRNGQYVVGMVTAEEVLDESNPFQELISGAGWLVRSGVNHVEGSARDGHLDILRTGWDGKTHGEDIGKGLDDVLTAKLARTALGHDAEGRLILLQTTGAAASADQDAAIQDGLELSEFADILVEAGAINAINLVGGGPAAMTQNHSAIVDPTGDCNNGVNEGFVNGSMLSRCDVPVSSIVCMHLDPPPFVPGAEGMGTTPASATSGDDFGSAYGGGSAWSSGSGSDSAWRDDDGGGGADKTREEWAEELCANNGSVNSTIWDHLDDVEEAVLRYKIAFWVVSVLGMVSLYFNIQHHKSSSASSSYNGGNRAPYGNDSSDHIGNIGTIDGGGLKSAAVTTGVEMAKVNSSREHKKGSRSGKGRRHRGSSSHGGYAKLDEDNLDADGADNGPQRGLMGPSTNGFYAGDTDEEEVDLGLVQQTQPSSSRKREKNKSSRLKKALARVTKGTGGGEMHPSPTAGSNTDVAMSINPFGGGGRGGARRGTPNRGDYEEGGTWA